MKSWSYIITPLFTWLITGLLKFFINSIKAKRLAFDLIGYGGMPSNHTAIVSSMAMLIACREGIDHPAFGVAITLAFIVILDAHHLRREIGKHATHINTLSSNTSSLRERIGHSRSEIMAGLCVGIVVGWLLAFI